MPPKRKTKDAPSPSRPAVSRARTTRASKASPAADGNDQESDALPRRPAKKARKAGPKAAWLDEDLDDDFEKPGRGRASKPATVEQHLMDQSKKSKAFIQGFKEQVAQGRARVDDALAKLRQELHKSHNAESDNRDDDDDDGVYAALRAAARQSLSTDDNPLFAQTQQLLRLGRAVLACHQTADGESRRAGRSLEAASPREAWKRDEEGMRRLLERGRAYSERVVEGWIVAPGQGGDGESGSDGGEGDEEGMSEAENLARGLFEWRRRKREREEAWGVAARKQMVALAGVVRTLPGRKGEGEKE